MGLRSFTGILSLLACVLSSSILFAQAEPADTDQYPVKLKEVLEQLNSQDILIGRASAQIKELQDGIEESDRAIEMVSATLLDIEQQIDEHEKNIEELSRTRDTLNVEIQANSKTVSWHLHSEYRLRHTHWLKDLLRPQDRKARQQGTRYHNYFVRSKTDFIEQFQQTLIELEQTSVTLIEKQNLLKQEQTNAQSTQEDLQFKSALRRNNIHALEREINEAQLTSAKLRDDQQRLQALISEIETLTSPTITSIVDNNQKPRYSPVVGTVVREFGESRADGRLKWNGVLYSADADTDVVAVLAGRVVMADWLKGYGMVVVVDHGNELKSIYANCNSIFVEVGDDVEAGENIGVVGESGGATTPSLYFEVLENGEPIDPIKWLESQTE